MQFSAGQPVKCVAQHYWQRHKHLAPNELAERIKFPMDGERYTVLKTTNDEGDEFLELLELGSEYVWDARAFSRA